MHPDFAPRRPFSFLVRAGALFAVAWAVSLAGFAWKGLLPGDLVCDTNICFIPYREFLLRSIWSGRFPDYAPGMFFGHAFMTYGQPMLLYPTVLAGLVFPVPHGVFFLGDLWIHGVVASTGCTWLLRRRGASVWTALALGWAYPNTTAFLFRAQGHWTILHQAALLPWVLVAWEALDQARPGKTWKPFVGLSVVAALVLMSRTPHIPYLLVLILIPLEGVRSARRRGRLGIGRRGLLLAAAAVGALLLAAVDVLPPIAGLRSSFRWIVGGTGLSEAWPLSTVNLLGLFSPYGLFESGPGRFLGNWWPQESVVIVGRTVAVLACAGIGMLAMRPVRLLGRGLLPMALIVGGGAFAMAGEIAWLRGPLVHLPLFDTLRAWGRAGIFVALGVVMLAALGMDALVNRARLRKRLPLVVLVTIALIAVLLLYILFRLGGGMSGAEDWMTSLGWHVERFRDEPGGLMAVTKSIRRALWQDMIVYGALACLMAGMLIDARRGRVAVRAALLLFVVVEAVSFQRFVFQARTRPLTPAATPELAAALNELQAARAPEPLTISFAPPELMNFAVFFAGTRSLSGVDSNLQAAYGLWLNRVQGLPPDTDQLSTRIEEYPEELIAATGLRAVVERKPGISVDGRTAGLDFYRVLENVNVRPYGEVVAPNGGTQLQGEVETVDWEPGCARIRVNVDAPAVLLVREFPNPRWKARINGHSAAIEFAGKRLRLAVPAGGCEVDLRYADVVARASLVISAIAWCALAGWALLRGRRVKFRRREAAADPESR